jgi:hypothetical protein
MKRYAISRPSIVVAVALLTGAFAIAQGITPPPTKLSVGDIMPGKSSRIPEERVPGSFVVKWNPAMIDATKPYPTYLLTTYRKGCTFVNTAQSGQFRQATFAAPPYQVKLQCPCGYKYVARVATFSGVVGVNNSEWADAPPALIPCEK